jgi:H+/Cl- antiporter ClcA
MTVSAHNLQTHYLSDYASGHHNNFKLLWFIAALLGLVRLSLALRKLMDAPENRGMGRLRAEKQFHGHKNGFPLERLYMKSRHFNTAVSLLQETKSYSGRFLIGNPVNE